MRIATAAMLASCAGLLGACDTKAPSPTPEETTIAVDGKEVTVEATPTPGATDSPAPLDPEIPAADTAPAEADGPAGDEPDDDGAPLNAIPARFLGQWDAADGPCTANSEMYLTIRPGTITFYESQGEVTGVRRGKPGIVVTLAMQGEGESWTSEYAMSLVRGGEQLATRVLPDSGPGSTRRRCAPERTATP